MNVVMVPYQTGFLVRRDLKDNLPRLAAVNVRAQVFDFGRYIQAVEVKINEIETPETIGRLVLLISKSVG